LEHKNLKNPRAINVVKETNWRIIVLLDWKSFNAVLLICSIAASSIILYLGATIRFVVFTMGSKLFKPFLSDLVCCTLYKLNNTKWF
ncbi:unnamed protein product, partial [Callosobruchus maculatus]